MKKNKRLKKRVLFSSTIVLKTSSLSNRRRKRNMRWIKSRGRFSKRLRLKKCKPIFPCPPKRCRKKRPESLNCCSRLADLLTAASKLILEKECCGNLLIQGNQAEHEIWATDMEAKKNVVQISITTSSSSTDMLYVKIIGKKKHQMKVTAGNTSTFVGHDVQSVIVCVQGNEQTYIDGKYAISASFYPRPTTCCSHNNKQGDSLT
ncbi:S-Ena type endospore appendage [Paenibacillus sinopodophylli]|uniref:S-Ena type endospore appendage n=1 Tax=Paenibacillus sinopodophylli TaxID=1837342 RepID=UPI00110CF4FB|nr:S-Ena type endospore appendage [Paenibacillus sinopodophylli]